MVTFAPQVQPTQDPNWTRESHPIGAIPPDTSTGMALTTAANTVKEGTQLADTLTKQSITTDTDAGVDKLRDAYTDTLKGIRNAQIGSQDQSLLPQDPGANPPPQSLQNGLDRVNQIGTAMAQNGGKINDTLYTGALNSLAKQLRSSYPGYRDYIDEQIKSVSGVDPANAFMRNLMEDINKNAESNKTDMNATMSTLRENANQGFHDKLGVSAANVMDMVRAGRLTPGQATQWLNGAKSLQYDLAQKTQARTDRQADDADAAKTASKDLSDSTGRIISQGWDTVTLGKGTDTFGGMAKFIQDNTGNEGVQDQQSQIVGQKMRQLRNQMWNAAWTHAQEGGPNSLFNRMGGDGEAVKKAIDSRFGMMDLAITDIFNKDWGAAYSHMLSNKAISADTTNLLYNASDADVRLYNRMSGIIQQNGPFSSDFFKQSVLGNVPQGEKDLLKVVKMKMITQPYMGDGTVVSAQSAINEMRSKGITSPRSYKDFIDSVGVLSNPKADMDMKVNVARGFFDPTLNQDLLSDKNFKMDTVVNGRQVPGKYAVWNVLSNGDTGNAIATLGKSRPDIVKDYDTMMTQQFGSQLFGREIKDLGNENSGSFLSRNFNNGVFQPQYKIAYMSDNKAVPRFDIVNPDGSPMTAQRANELGAPVASVNRMNGGIAGLYNVYSATGHKDINTDILSTMYKYGYQDPAASGNKSITEYPKMFWNAIMSSQRDKLSEKSLSDLVTEGSK